MKGVWIALIFGVGLLMPLQAGINATLGRHLGEDLTSPAQGRLLAAGVNFLVGLASFLVVLALLRPEWPSAAAWTAAPWWAWLGGLCGASLVLSATFAAPRLGAALLVASLVAGQLIASVIVDHFGLVGYARQPVNLLRVAGVGLLLAGLWLIQRSGD